MQRKFIDGDGGKFGRLIFRDVVEVAEANDSPAVLIGESEVPHAIELECPQPFWEFRADLTNLAIFKVWVILAKEPNTNLTQTENAKAPNEKEDQPPSEDVTLAAAGFSAIENEVVIGDRLKEFTLSISWVYQLLEAGCLRKA